MKYQQLVLQLVIRRHALGMTQQEVAERMGQNSHQHLGRLESIEVIASVPTLEAWTMALGVSLHFDMRIRRGRKQDG